MVLGGSWGVPGASQRPYGDLLTNFWPIWSYKTPESQISTFGEFLGTRIDLQILPFCPRSPQSKYLFFYFKINKSPPKTHKQPTVNCPTIVMAFFPDNLLWSQHCPITRFVDLNIFQQQDLLILIFPNNKIFHS